MPTPGEQLTEARAAYHRLQLGELAVSFRDGNGEQVEYNRASAPRLAAYINDLERQAMGIKSPQTFLFQTSKGLN
ncbi:gpW family protein [Heliomarina baculiformis]|uniref:gpW family protein n=1 Tax=Heliomarina baculiformis TaxID=2872036 RepID=UPI001EE2A47A|nr:gpW family protein [Heliomarina baculiformis]